MTMPKNNTGSINIQAIINEYGVLSASDIRPEDYSIVAKKVSNRRNGTEYLFNVIPVAALVGGGGIQSVVLNNLNPLFTVANIGTVNNAIFNFTAIVQNPHMFYAGPTKNPAAIPTFRAIELSDLPYAGNPGDVLTTDGTVASWQPAGGLSDWKLGGNVVGSLQLLGTKDNFDLPFITNNNEVARFTTDGVGLTRFYINATTNLHGSNAGIQYATTFANRTQARFNAYGNHGGVAGITGFKSRGATVGATQSVLAGDTLFRITAIGISGDNVSLNLAALVDLKVSPGGVFPAYVATDFTIDLMNLAGVRTQKFIVTSEGRVGLGTATVPTNTLHIGGTFRYVDGNETLGYVLTSDASGVASWQAVPAAGPIATTAGNTLLTCITDIFVQNVNSCSPLNINASNGQDVYMVAGGGNVGIGTITPGALFHVNGDTGTWISSPTVGYGKMKLIPYSPGQLYASLVDADNTELRMGGNLGAYAGRWRLTNVANNARLAINKATADATLDVVAEGSGYSTVFQIKNSAANVNLLMFDNNELYFDYGTVAQTTKHTSGRWDFANVVTVGGPTNTGYERFQVKGQTSDATAYAIQAVNSSNTVLLAVRNDGVVWINSTDPGAQFSVYTSATPLYRDGIVGNASASDGIGIKGTGAYGVSGYTAAVAYGVGVYGNASSLPYTGYGGQFIGGIVALEGRSSTSDATSFIFSLLDSGSVQKVAVLGNGDFGIGISAPTAKLHVVIAGINPAIKLSNATYDVDIRPSGPSTLSELNTNNIGWQVSSTDGYFRLNRTAGSGAALIYVNGTATGLALSGAVAGTEHMKINSVGNVGIGTSSPSASTLLDLSSTSGALLITRLTTVQKGLLTPINGMIVYDTDLGKFQGYEAGAWVNLV